MSVIKIAFFSNIFPNYRKEIFSILSSDKSYNLDLFYGIDFASNIPQINNVGYPNVIKNIYFFNHLIWQKNVLYKILFKNYNILIFTGESSCISTWFGSLLGKLLRKKIIFWGHGEYGNEFGLKKYYRRIFNLIPNKHLVYSHYSKKLLSSYFKSDNIYVIYNSIEYLNSLNFRPTDNIIKSYNKKKFSLLYVGRLNKNKNLMLLIKLMIILNNDDFELNIIGDGPEYIKLNLLKIKYNLNIKFLKSIHDHNSLSKIFYNSDLTISPGNIGLLAILSLQYGNPICTHNVIEKQMPEFEALINNYNGFTFDYNNFFDLKNKLLDFLKNKNFDNSVCFKVIDDYYNPIVQKNIFLNCIKSFSI
jgi:glycosyltransferase involved in cell wall biosynthesis